MKSDSTRRHGAPVGLPVPDRSSVLVLPIGGTDRVGMNCYLVGHAGSWLMIDAGATFAGADDDRAASIAETHGGVLEQIVPDWRIVAGSGARIEGLVLTHAHEDHVGGLAAMHRYAHLWPSLARLPVYATPYTREIARAKISEVGPLPRLNRMEFRKPVRIGPFDVVPLRVTHSAPETCALAIRTPVGTVVFGSDMKLDPDPVLGPRTDVEAFAALGASGVLAFCGDSTNAGHSGRSVSEGDVLRGLTSLMRGHPGRVAVSTFSSNLARLVGTVAAAKSSHRMVGSSGRSIQRNVEAGMAAGLIPQSGAGLVEPRILAGLPPRRAALVCTGTQAELNSALRRMADDIELGRRGRGFRLEAGDLLVHSARVIPGNEATVKAMLDTFRGAGIRVLEAGGPEAVVHASGHAKRDELADVYRMLRPRFAVPVHGDADLIAAHQDLAMGMPGVAGVVSPREGEILRISPDGAKIAGRIPTAELAVIAVGGRNAGASRLVGWRGAKGILAESGQARRPQRRPEPARQRDMRPVPSL